jgi:hypothetical protein
LVPYGGTCDGEGIPITALFYRSMCHFHNRRTLFPMRSFGRPQCRHSLRFDCLRLEIRAITGETSNGKKSSAIGPSFSFSFVMRSRSYSASPDPVRMAHSRHPAKAQRRQHRTCRRHCHQAGTDPVEQPATRATNDSQFPRWSLNHGEAISNICLDVRFRGLSRHA